MRLGLRPTVFQKNTEDSLIRQLYGGNEMIWERHRHRWEINPEYVDKIEAAGLRFTGRDGRGERMQVAELPRERSSLNTILTMTFAKLRFTGSEHPYYCGMQAHPEFCTRPLNPSPGYLGFVAAACGPQVLAEQLERQKTFKQPQPDRHLRLPTPLGSPLASPTIQKFKNMEVNGHLAKPEGIEDEFNLNIQHSTP